MGSLSASFFMMEKDTFRWPTFFLIFITYYSGYLYTKYQSTPLLKKILILNALAGIVCIVLVLKNHNIERLYKWAVICGMGLLYNSDFLSKSIRQIPLLKIFYVGLVWALVNAWLSFPQFCLPVFMTSVLYISALVLPFDIRDINSDNIITIPKMIGIKGTKILGSMMILAAVIIATYTLRSEFAFAFGISGMISILLLCLARPNFRDSYFSFGVELCSGLPVLLLFITGFQDLPTP